VIGYYVHHVGRGHLHRATAIAHALGEPVTGFSSLPAPPDWPGPWIQLERDDDGLEGVDGDPADRTAGDRLHWVPLRHHGLRSRMAEIAAWIRHVAPRVFVVDVSVEVAVLVRLHGVPVVTVAGPGHRDDQAHQLGYDVSDTIIGCWPAGAAGMLTGVRPALLERLVPVGGLSRFSVVERGERRPGPPRVVLMSGAGGRDLDAHRLELARKETPDWEWTVLDAELGEWVDDPSALLADADVALTHAGQNAVAEVAASRVPAVVVPQERPHREQQTTGAVLRDGPWPALVLDDFPDHGWSDVLERAVHLDGADWALWCDGEAAHRAAEVVRTVGAGGQP
jgi:hypothetical protein